MWGYLNPEEGGAIINYQELQDTQKLCTEQLP